MATRYLYPMSGGSAAFYEINGFIYEMGGESKFYIRNNYVYTMNGDAAYWIKGKYLYSYLNSTAELYFG
jgi:hypothetical protein